MINEDIQFCIEQLKKIFNAVYECFLEAHLDVLTIFLKDPDGLLKIYSMTTLSKCVSIGAALSEVISRNQTEVIIPDGIEDGNNDSE